ncbi:MAG: putative TonB family protein [Treponematales bacterium]
MLLAGHSPCRVSRAGAGNRRREQRRAGSAGDAAFRAGEPRGGGKRRAAPRAVPQAAGKAPPPAGEAAAGTRGEAAEAPEESAAAGEGTAGPGNAPEAGGAPAGDSARAYRSRNIGGIQRRVQDSLRYPERARRAGIQGTVEVAFRVEADGAAARLVVKTSSGSALLDEAALDAVARAAPFSPPGTETGVVIPIVFRIE